MTEIINYNLIFFCENQNSTVFYRVFFNELVRFEVITNYFVALPKGLIHSSLYDCAKKRLQGVTTVI